MRRVHEKSIILGIGIGIIITSIAGMIFYGGQSGDSTEKMSKEEIIRLAKSYGMVGPVPLIDDTAEDTATASNSTAASSQTTTPDTSAKPTPSKETAPYTTAEPTSSQATSTGAPRKETSTSSTAAGGAENAERDISIEIEAGFDSFEVSELLYSKGIITSKEKFESTLDAYNASTKIKIGTYKFKINEDYDYIVKTICSIK